ncbi:MAG TPA: hypothetical protein PK987_06580 [Ferruginibacter sp.]|nr:hypothetical protein [Ferruginibacter sp.]
MQKQIKSVLLFRWATVFLVTSFFFIACNSGETKKEDAPMPAPVEAKKDSLPPIDHDTLIKDKPEVIINKPGS